MFRRVMRRLLLAGLDGRLMPGRAAGGAPGRPSVPGWRIVWTDHVTGPSTFVASSATGPGDAWIGGASGASGPSSGKPLIYHWNGHAWGAAKLPSGLTGAIMVIRASAPKNVWAFGEDDRKGTAFAMRWDGHGWTIVQAVVRNGGLLRRRACVRPDGRVGYSGAIRTRSCTTPAVPPGTAARFPASWPSPRPVACRQGTSWGCRAKHFRRDQSGRGARRAGRMAGRAVPRIPEWKRWPRPSPTSTSARPMTPGRWAGNPSPANKWYPNLAHWNGHAWQKVT